MYFITEVKAVGNKPVNDTEIIGINTNSVFNIIKLDDNSIWFFTGGSDHYIKLFNSKEEREDYFNYLTTKLELMGFIRLKWIDDYDKKPHDVIMNFNKVRKIDKDYDAMNRSYRIIIFTEGEQPRISFKNTDDANQYYDCIMEKLRAFKIEEKHC